MIRTFTTALAVVLAVVATGRAQDAEPGEEAAAESRPLKALLVAGGCCHDYKAQHKVLYEGIQARASVRVDVYWTDDRSTNPPLPLYEKDDWAKGYDVVIHDECAAGNRDVAVVRRILKAHETVPAVHLHCAMHSFRNGTDLWFKHLGLTSRGHGPQRPIEIEYVDREHPITEGLEDWTTDNEELYNNTEVFDAHPLARGRQTTRRGGEERVTEFIVAWTNEKQGARSFSTTIGHNTKTVADDRYLDLVTRGLLWACGKLDEEHLVPYEGENTVTFVSKDKKPPETARPHKQAVMPENATLVKPTASTVQRTHEPEDAFDGDPSTRWCARNHEYPQWLQLEFEKPRSVSHMKIVWERPFAYRYRVEGSVDGESWTTVLDASNNTVDEARFVKLDASKPVKFLRITGLGTRRGGWCSIREVSLKGEGIEALWPADPDGKPREFTPVRLDPFKSQGNVTPRIEKLSPDREAEILEDVKVADGFEATVFAAPPAVNYPVFVAAAPDGTLYVSSDGNGSLGRDPGRGRVIRLRDLDGDGRADETRVFCEVDAPRGLVWDHDRLYLMHPPHLSAFIDRDGDGRAEEQEVLVKDLAFGYDKRPADHTTNGVSIGVDGWLYIAGGDFGFLDAEGTDGRRVTHRGGGVLRVRPDGSGLEIYATGTRNIVEVAVSPRLDLFARDNTNDGGGWDVRLHHFTGGGDHGYPRLYKNFAGECRTPVADYGGGSGCGAVYIDEPGFGEWNDAPFTVDWGKGALYQHSLRPSGATFEETGPPRPFIRMTNPTDADVDALGRVYCASWRGARFNWAGPDVGYIVCVKPEGFEPDPLPPFSKLEDEALIDLLESPSYRRRLAAQRELARRGNDAHQKLLEAGVARRNEARNLADRLQGEATEAEVVEALSHADPVIVHIAVRSLARRGAAVACFAALDRGTSSSEGLLRALARMHRPEVVTGLLQRLEKSTDPERRREILAALCRLHFREGEWRGDSWGTRPDTRGPYYQPEPWSETKRIAAALDTALAEAPQAEAAFLIAEMGRNRIESRGSLRQLVALAANNDDLLEDVTKRLAAADDIPGASIPLLVRASRDASAPPALLASAVMALSRVDTADSVPAMLSALAALDDARGARGERRRARGAFLSSRALENHVETLRSAAEQEGSGTAFWADAGLLSVVSRKDVSVEPRYQAQQAIDAAWKEPGRRMRLMRVAARIESAALDRRILTAVDDSDPEVAEVARSVVERLKIRSASDDRTPRIGTLAVEDALSQAVATEGDARRGERLVRELNCLACHTLTEDEPQKGPFLRTIAQTYQRPQLAEAVLQPGRTIAQGFAMASVVTADGVVIKGFVTNESADRVTLRDGEAREYTIPKKDIVLRETSPDSMMPAGLVNDYTVHDLASILDYLESLASS